MKREQQQLRIQIRGSYSFDLYDGKRGCKKKFAFFIRKDGIEICDEKFATVGFCPCTDIVVHPFRKAKTEFSSYEMKNIMSKLDFTLSEVDNSATVSYSKAYQDVKANKRKWGEYRTYKWKTRS